MTKTVDLSEPRRSRTRELVFLVWTLVAIVWALGLWIQIGLPLGIALLHSAMDSYTLALLMIPVARIAARLGDRSLALTRLLTAHLAMGLVVLVIWKSLIVLYMYLAMGSRFWSLALAGTWLFQLLGAATTYTAALGILLTVQAMQRERARERREAALTLTAREAELAALKSHLQPHFLFNALNAVVALIDHDPPEARQLVLRLAELLHASRLDLDREQVPLSREFDLLRAYLDVEQARLGSRLSVECSIDPAARQLGVPPLIMLPLVENAIKHGIAPHSRPGAVALSATCEDGMIALRVTDTGEGADSDALERGGVGLELTRRRLDALYPSCHQLTFRREPGRFVAELRVPATTM